MFRPGLLILVAFLPVVSHSDCTLDNANVKAGLSGESLAVRNELFFKLCQSEGGDFFDMTDPALGKRFRSPLRKGNLVSIIGEYPHDYKKPVTVAYFVDLHGSVKYPTILIGSGNAATDAQIVRAMYQLKFKDPGEVDGKPARVLMYWTMTLK